MATTYRIFTGTTAAILVATLLTPAAQAQTTELPATLDGQAQWNVRDSFLSYLQGRIANGTVNVSEGATFTATKGPLTLPINAEGTTVSAKDKGTIDFDGTVHFSGHSGQLDLTFSDFKLLVDGDKGQITVDYRSRAISGDDYVEGQDGVLVEVAFEEPVDFTKESTLKGTTTLTQEGVAIFADFYKAGDPMAPLFVNVAPVAKEEPAPSPTPEPSTPAEPTTSVPSPAPTTPSESTPAPKPSGSSLDGSSARSITGPLAALLGVGALGAIIATLARHFINFPR